MHVPAEPQSARIFFISLLTAFLKAVYGRPIVGNIQSRNLSEVPRRQGSRSWSSRRGTDETHVLVEPVRRIRNRPGGTLARSKRSGTAGFQGSHAHVGVATVGGIAATDQDG